VGSLSLRPGDLLTIPRMALSVGFIRFVSFTDATPATKLPTVALVGLTPTEHACLSGHTGAQKPHRPHMRPKNHLLHGFGTSIFSTMIGGGLWLFRL
jgi:hypothetical protein